jgi:hypothetical protein
MVDLALLPITPIMGNGRAPLQPLEVNDAAERIAFLALTEPTARPVQCSAKTSAMNFVGTSLHRARSSQSSSSSEPRNSQPTGTTADWYDKRCEQRHDWARPKINPGRQYTWRMYDAVGPETMVRCFLLVFFPGRSRVIIQNLVNVFCVTSTSDG